MTDIVRQAAAGEARPEATPTERTYERLSALDASFLHAETPTTPLHVGSVAVFEGSPFFDERGRFRIDELRQRVADRLHLVPRFRRKVMWVPFGQGRPVWVDHADFDIANHVKVMVLPGPGTREQLFELCELLQMRMLDRDRPLWELWFVGGLDDGNVALIEKVHHALVDGVSGVDAATATLDLERDPPPAEVPPWRPAPPPTPGRLLVESWWQRATDPVELARSAQAVLRVPARLAREAAEIGGALSSLGDPRSLLSSTSLIRPVGRRRRLVSVRQELADLKRAKAAFGATVNDVVLAAVAGGVRRLLASRGEPVDGRELHVLVPVSVRADHEHLALGNKVSSLFIPLPIGEDSAIGRLELVRQAVGEQKERNLAEGTELVLEWMDHLPPMLTAMLARSIHRQPFVDLVVTNVPGPQVPLYCMGAEMLEATSVVPLGGNLSVGIAILSYNGWLTLGIHADRDACPDVAVLADGIRESFAELVALEPDAG
jgi:WS/DGAT/MGAT family acyltransferase